MNDATHEDAETTLALAIHMRMPPGLAAAFDTARDFACAGEGMTSAAFIRRACRLAVTELRKGAAGERIPRCAETATRETAPTTVEGEEVVQLAKELAAYGVRPIDAVAWQVAKLLAARASVRPLEIPDDDRGVGYLVRDPDNMIHRRATRRR